MTATELLDGVISRCLADIRQDGQHEFNPANRLAVYRALCPSLKLESGLDDSLLPTEKLEISYQQRLYGYFGIVTAEYVLPIWDQNKLSNPSDAPRKILATAEAVLANRLDPSAANGLYLQDYYYLLDTESFEVRYSAWRALGAAYSALGMSLGAPPFQRIRDHRPNVTDIRLVDHDTAADAVVAFSVVDKNEPEAWRKNHFKKPTREFDLKKRLQFWEWWLIEAIPAAKAQAG